MTCGTRRDTGKRGVDGRARGHEGRDVGVVGEGTWVLYDERVRPGPCTRKGETLGGENRRERWIYLKGKGRSEPCYKEAKVHRVGFTGQDSSYGRSVVQVLGVDGYPTERDWTILRIVWDML